MEYQRSVVRTFAFVCCAFVSCSDTALPPAVFPGVIMPLRVNNMWEYEVTILDRAGSTIGLFIDSTRIVAEREIADEKWFVDDDGVVQMNRSDGRWIFSGVAYLAEKYPAMLNDTYMLSDSVTMIYVAGVNEPVRLPIGTFSTYVYRRTRGGVLTAELYFAPNTGLVKLDRYSSDADGVYRSESRLLRSIHLQ